MNKHNTLSSGQALDDYFEALLDDLGDSSESDSQSVTPDLGVTRVSSASLIEDNDPTQPRLQPKPQPSAAPLKPDPVAYAEPERDLAEVERLLAQLRIDEEAEVDAQAETSTQTETECAQDTATETTEPLVEEASESVVDTYTMADWGLEEKDAITVDESVPEVETETETETEIDEDVSVESEATVSTSDQEEVRVDETFRTEQAQQADVDVEVDTQAGEEIPPTQWENAETEAEFQVLFFESMGVTYAVPLAELGGIHQLGDCNRLIGRPDWYLGLQTEKQQQLDVVDTARWVMPEKLADNQHRDDYNYIVILGDSKWGLACDQLLGTQALSGKAIRWRKQAGKRPWLAGMVKEKMCALIHVPAFIAMLNQGIDAKAMA